MTLSEKLSQIQVAFKSKKSRFNNFGKYNFRSAEDILEAIKPHLDNHKVYVTINEELIATDPMPIVKSIASITDGKDTISAEAVVGVDLAQKGMQVPQQFGSASSYGKKYSLGNLLLIDDTQDSDATNIHDKKAMSAAEIKKAKDYLKGGGKLEAIKQKYNVTPEIEKQLV